jgi:hypothetical protein
MLQQLEKWSSFRLVGRRVFAEQTRPSTGLSRCEASAPLGENTYSRNDMVFFLIPHRSFDRSVPRPKRL